MWGKSFAPFCFVFCLVCVTRYRYRYRRRHRRLLKSQVSCILLTHPTRPAIATTKKKKNINNNSNNNNNNKCNSYNNPIDNTKTAIVTETESFWHFSLSLTCSKNVYYVCVVDFRPCSLVGYLKSLNWPPREANMVEHIARILEKGTRTRCWLYHTKENEKRI